MAGELEVLTDYLSEQWQARRDAAQTEEERAALEDCPESGNEAQTREFLRFCRGPRHALHSIAPAAWSSLPRGDWIAKHLQPEETTIEGLLAVGIQALNDLSARILLPPEGLRARGLLTSYVWSITTPLQPGEELGDWTNSFAEAVDAVQGWLDRNEVNQESSAYSMVMAARHFLWGATLPEDCSFLLAQGLARIAHGAGLHWQQYLDSSSTPSASKTYWYYCRKQHTSHAQLVRQYIPMPRPLEDK